MITMLLLTGAASLACAQSDSSYVDLTELNLEELSNVKIVTASKTSQEAGQAPANVYVVTEEQIRIRGYRSLLDVLMDAPDFKIDDKVYSVSMNTITTRGIEGQEKLIILLDGTRISSPTNEAMPIMENYPVNLAKQIEIVYGPASALYGADAVSGVINIISKKTEFTSSKIEATASTGDRGLTNGTLFVSKKFAKEVVLTASGQYYYDPGVNYTKLYRSDSTWNFNSHATGTFNTIYGPMTPQHPVSPKYAAPLMAYNFYTRLKAGDFELSLFNNYSQNSTAIDNTPDNAVYNKDVFYKRSITNINARHTRSINGLTFTSTLSATQYKLDPQSNYRNLYTGMEPAYKYAYGSMVQAEEQVEWVPTKNTTLVGGAVYQNFVSLPESTDLQEPVSPGRSIEGILLNSASYYHPEGLAAKFYVIKYYNAGMYVQVQQKAGRKIILTAGARYDHNSRFGSTFNPRAGVVVNATRKTTIKLMMATAYLAPPPATCYAYWGTFNTADSGKTYHANFMHLPNPELKPLISRNAEISVRHYLDDNFSVTLDGYYTRQSNVINYGSDSDHANMYDGKFLGWPVDYIEIFVNNGTEQALGGSLMLAYNRNLARGWVRAYSNISYVDGKETEIAASSSTTDSRQLDYISTWIVKSGVDLSIKNFYASPRLIVIGRQRIAGLEDSGEPGKRQTIKGYSLLNISVGYKFGKTSVFANVTNALNQKYRAVGPNMDLLNGNSGLFNGSPQDPIRATTGVRLSL